jgi:hypothetical protein
LSLRARRREERSKEEGWGRYRACPQSLPFGGKPFLGIFNSVESISTVPDTKRDDWRAVQGVDATCYALDIADIFDIRFKDQRMASAQLPRAKSPRSYSWRSRLGNRYFFTSEDLPPDTHRSRLERQSRILEGYSEDHHIWNTSRVSSAIILASRVSAER